MERSKLISGLAGVMALVLIMVGVYLYKHMPSKVAATARPGATAAVSPTQPRQVLLLPPPVFTKPVPRPVISDYKPKHARIEFSKLEKNFTGTWAAYPQLCDSAWYNVQGRRISVAGAGTCDLRNMQSQITSRTTVTSVTLVLDCHHNSYNGKETWNLTQPRPGALNIRPLYADGSGNAVSLYRCPAQVASAQ
jgi:hypothetical protein